MMMTATTTRLLADLRNARNDGAWAELDARYRPILVRFSLQLGFVGDDSEELAQQTLAEFARSYSDGKYDPQRGRLRSWLLGIARNVAFELRRKKAGLHNGVDSLLEQIPDDARLSVIWEQQREQAIFAEALARLRSSTQTDAATIEAFELYAVQGMPVEHVAERCGLSVDSVYVAKNRLTKRLRELVAELTAAYSEGE
ncbi:MAG: sigma-70 family RNA polymerase sigma factor [Planctomycetes bacterium]|nr:sigma-70 family RNA polymerase sigma factor [Planctomycetota bacterium]